MNLVVVGGGTAGWLTALYAKKTNPNATVTLIESEEIGILGAGEGTTPHLVSILDFLEIPVSDLVKECKTTIKNGIKFTNWQDKKYYYHPFIQNSLASEQSGNFIFNYYAENYTEISHLYASISNLEQKDYCFIDKISEKNKVPFERKILTSDFSPINAIQFFTSLASWSIHFDANILAKFFRKIAESRGVVRVEGKVIETKQDSDGFITTLKTENKSIPVDFVFDCTGFRRLLIGNLYKSTWDSHAESLPAKKAIPFFLPPNEDIPPYTEAIAMKYGWMWKIPLQHRYGCGYVFDSDMISDDDAKKEIDLLLKTEVESPRTFTFNAGCYKEIWIKNCLAVGLSSGFLEPLEATSIWQSGIVLRRFFSEKTNLTTKNPKIINNFNNKFYLETKEIVDFLYLHYLTNKKNTVFWKNFSKNNKMPDFIEYILEVCQERMISQELDFTGKEMFNCSSYMYVLTGNGLISNDTLKKHARNQFFDRNIDFLKIKKNQEILEPSIISHLEFLQELSK